MKKSNNNTMPTTTRLYDCSTMSNDIYATANFIESFLYSDIDSENVLTDALEAEVRNFGEEDPIEVTFNQAGEVIAVGHYYPRRLRNSKKTKRNYTDHKSFKNRKFSKTKSSIQYPTRKAVGVVLI